MRFSESWLREWVNPEVDTRTLADQLTMAGIEVDAVEPAAPEFSGVLVGQVQAIEGHPNAEKLRLCRVNVGSGGEPLQIICGAANVAADMKVPVAMLGACLPGEVEIKLAKLHGVESLGMICATNLSLDLTNPQGYGISSSSLFSASLSRIAHRSCWRLSSNLNFLIFITARKSEFV